MGVILQQSGGGGTGGTTVNTIAKVSHLFLDSFTAATGLFTASQPAFTDISGSVAASQLPNPSASTLGGIQSLAAVGSKWINAISTSGVPSATQPAASDLSVAALANGITATTQAALDNSTKLATTAYADAAVAAATLTVASGGYELLPWERYSTTANYAVNALAASAVGATIIRVRDTITINSAQAVCGANTAASATNFYIGIYNLAGTLLIELKFVLTSNQTGIITAALTPSSFKLPPGTYIYAWGCEISVSTLTMLGFEIQSGAASFTGMLNTSSTRIGSKAAMISSGHLVGSGLTQAALTVQNTAFTSIPYCVVNT